MNYLDEIVAAQKRGEIRGVTSVCSAHPSVLSAAMRQALLHETHLLVESTCNQVNQYGGYIGMTPRNFVDALLQMTAHMGFPKGNLILGGDHLGPEVWRNQSAKKAMQKARVLVRDYVRAGYLKVHLDASMKLGGDPEGSLSVETAADRAADLAQVAEEVDLEGGSDPALRYVIGTEVPVPGGAREVGNHLQVTRVFDAEETLEATRRAFFKRGLGSAWERVIALVVQPGVEFGYDSICEYDHSATAALSGFIADRDLIFEAHSTDYQTPDALRQMVVDHFAVLKVGPALTFAYREAVFALAMMEAVLVPEHERSNLVNVLDEAMLANPIHWQDYYHGDPAQKRFSRMYSYSDRSRYYWSDPAVQASLTRLFNNLCKHPLPLSLVSQFLPVQFERVRSGKLVNDPEAFIQDKIMDVLEGYYEATIP